MRRQLFGDVHPSVATSLNNLSNVLQKQQRYAAAEPLAREVVGLRRRLLGDEHPSTITALNNLGVLLTPFGRPQEAEGVLREGIAAATKRLPAEHPSRSAYRCRWPAPWRGRRRTPRPMPCSSGSTTCA